METARISARVAGVDVKTAYEEITDAISTGMPKALKKYGLITKEEMAVVNAALKAGVTDVNLYSIAMDNAAIQATNFGQVNLNAAEGVQVHRARIQDFKESISVGFVTAIGTALGWLDKLIAANREAALANEGIFLETTKAPAIPAGSSEELEQGRSMALARKKANIDEVKARTEAIAADKKAAEELKKLQDESMKDLIKGAEEEIALIAKVNAFDVAENKKKILVTGGAGFVGSNLVMDLQEKYPEAQITIIDNLLSGDFRNLSGFKGDFIASNIVFVIFLLLLFFFFCYLFLNLF
jgi:hypothetical protein